KEAADWCLEGHQGRLCSQCRPGFFDQGRACQRCYAKAVHVLIVLANLALVAVLGALFWMQQTKAAAMQTALGEYVQRQRDAAMFAPHPDDMTGSEDLSFASGAHVSGLTPAASAASIPVVHDPVVRLAPDRSASASSLMLPSQVSRVSFFASSRASESRN